MKRVLYIISVLLLFLGVSCSKEDPDFHISTDVQPSEGGIRQPSTENGEVFLLYLAGRNSLSSYLKTNYKELLKGYIPRGDNGTSPYVLLVYSQYPAIDGSYNSAMESTLSRLYTNYSDEIIVDTLKTYGSEYISADSQTVKTVLSDVNKLFPAKSYGLLLSSHATGWLPAGYTSGKNNTESRADTPPVLHSIGQTIGPVKSYEMDLKNFAEAIPMHLNTLLFDCCLMGCVEVAYELREKCDFIAFSPTEILADGFDYTSLTQRLFRPEGPDVAAICDDMFSRYSDSSSNLNYCTISAIDCRNMEPLAQACRDIVSNHSSALANIDPSKVQGYFRFGWHWFYDLRDVFVQAGVPGSELMALDSALSGCMIRNLATKEFIGIPINTHCGLSMYLPCDGSPALDAYYSDLKWNQAIGLVK